MRTRAALMREPGLLELAELETYGCGYGFWLGTAEQDVAIHLAVTDPQAVASGELARETTLPDDAPLVILARPGLPRYLARSALVVRDGAEIRVLAGERWSEAPESALQRALLLRLRIRQERAAVLAWPAPRAGRILNVRFSRLDGPRGGPLDVAATLSLEDVPPRTTQFRVPVADDSIPALVAAHGRALDRLADEAAAYLNAALP
jgi:uncharacterized lipoprotein YmbA